MPEVRWGESGDSYTSVGELFWSKSLKKGTKSLKKHILYIFGPGISLLWLNAKEMIEQVYNEAGFFCLF